MKNKILILILIFIYSLTGFSAACRCAQTKAPIQREQLIPKAPEELLISFQDVSTLALANSLDIQIAKYDTYIKRNSLLKAKSIFDIFLNASAGYTDSELDPASTFAPTKEKQIAYSFGAQTKIPTGTELSFSGGDTRYTSNSPFNVINPYHEASLSASAVQPLGKNFFGLADRAQIKITKFDIKNTEYTTLNNIEKILADTQTAYWNFVLKCEELEIKRQVLLEAKKLLNIYKDKFEIGLVEQVDLIATKANTKVRESEVNIAELEKQTAKNDLLFLLNHNNLNIKLSPADSLSIKPEAVDLVDELGNAIETRRDYKIITNDLKANKIDIQVKKNALWPEIDLEASYKRNGIDPQYTKAWKEIRTADHSEIFVGMNVKFSLENRTSRAEKKEATQKKAQLLLNLKRIERLILRDLNNKVKEVNTYKNHVELYSQIVKLQREKLNEETKRLKYGRSNSDLIIRYETDLLNARVSLAQSLFKYRKSLIDLDLAKNTLLDKYWKDEL